MTSPERFPFLCRVESRTLLAGDIFHLRLSLPTSDRAAWSHRAGQYVSVAIPDTALPARSYSIASGPQRPWIDLHVRNLGNGMSQVLCSAAPDTLFLRLSQAEGCGLPPKACRRPLVLLAGGVGIAPICGLLDDLPDAIPPPALYWGVGDPAELYLSDHWQSLAAAGRLRRYHAVSGDVPLGTVLAADDLQLSTHAFYLAGPPAMIAETVPFLIRCGAEKEYIFGDGVEI